MTVDKIRLDSFEIEALKQNFHMFFGVDDHLWLFGSRVDPTALGGDIDLYIETIAEDMTTIRKNKLSFLYALYEVMGFQRIDVIINVLSHKTHLAIYDIAKNEGIRLV